MVVKGYAHLDITSSERECLFQSTLVNTEENDGKKITNEEKIATWRISSVSPLSVEAQYFPHIFVNL